MKIRFNGLKSCVFIFAFLVFFVYSSEVDAGNPLIAKDTRAIELEEETDESSGLTIESYFRYMPARSAEATSGKVEIIESETEYSYEFKAFEKLPVKFALTNQYISIEENVPTEIPAHLAGVSFDMETTLPFFGIEDTYLRLGIEPSFYGDDWDFEDSAFRAPSRYLIIYQPNERWTFVAGVAVYPDFETEVLPIGGFIYKPNDKLTFNIVPEIPNITYALNDKLSLFAELGMSNGEFEVDRDQFKNVVLKYQQTRVATGVNFKINQYIKTSFSVGGVFNRRLKYRDNVGKVNIKDGIYGEFKIKISI